MKGKTIVNFGDSIFGNFRTPVDISTFLSEKTGAVVYNAGFGGCRMAEHIGPHWDKFSMYRLADAVVSGDWSLQDAALERAAIDKEFELPYYFAESIEMLKSLDFNKVDMITISYASNDFTGQNIISDSANPYDTKTFMGAMRYSVEKIAAAFPNMKIVLCTPIYRYWWDNEVDRNFIYDSDTHEIIGQKLTDFVQCVKEFAAEKNLLCIDNYYNSGICKETIAQSFPENDNTHPSEMGRRMIADSIARELCK